MYMQITQLCVCVRVVLVVLVDIGLCSCEGQRAISGVAPQATSIVFLFVLFLFLKQCLELSGTGQVD